MASDLRAQIQVNLGDFVDKKLPDAANALLASLGYQSDRTITLGDSSPASFLQFLRSQSGDVPFDEKKALFSDWKSIHLLFQLTDEELSGHASLFKETDIAPSLLRSYLFFAVELTGADHTRGKLTGIARQLNRVFPMPVMLLIKHVTDKKQALSIAVINRRQHKRDAAKDVLGKVTIIRDIVLAEPHRGHLDILSSFAIPNLVHPQRLPINNFDSLHAAWEQIFNVELLNRRFYRELANWYFWALPQVQFPDDVEKDDAKRRATSLIRLLTRLIFCWFLKEKALIPEKLFVEAELKKILADLAPDSSTYYHAILQNLFFATLNQRMGKDKAGQPYRAFARDEGFQKNRATYGVDTLYRYEGLFRDPSTALALFGDVPFLNGGLFECLDRTEDGTDRKLYLDGFSRNRKKRPVVANELFFADERSVDLSDAYGDTKRRNEKVRGLLRILHSYKFTIVENTPIDQEIALDPELLGKVFENLLASYNEETKTTARKQTGSFYTPRPIVEYMVDESLKAHLGQALAIVGMSPADAEVGLETLFAYTEQTHLFTESEADTLLAAIHSCKVLDPACGSGAFPMGMLHKLVYVIHKLDPDNAKWKQLQIDTAAKIPDSSARDAAIAAIERDFADNPDDYGRKLYLIENCLYGVDIQPIAIQISKLRFFISLICDQRTNRSKQDNHGVRPLPNLETKFVAANSLIGLPDLGQMELVPPRVHQIEAEIESLYHSHFSIQRRVQKLTVQGKIKTLRTEMADLLSRSLMSRKKSKHIADWDPFDPQSSADFFDPHWMFGISVAHGFDITIGNPPYVRADEQSESNIAQRQAILASKQYETLWEKWDLFVPFLERSYKLLRIDGVSTMIVSDSFCHSKYAQKAQNWFLQNARILRLDFCGEVKIFDAAVHNVITCFQKSPGDKWKPERRLHREAFGEVTDLPSDEQAKLTNRTFFPEESLHEGFSASVLPIGSICYVSFGCRPNSDEKRAKGLFVAADLVSGTKDSDHPKPYIEAKDIVRWTYSQTRWLEWGTGRSPGLLTRPTFVQLYEVPEKIVAADVSGAENRAAYDEQRVFHSHTLISFVLWDSLHGVRNNSLKKAARYHSENPLRPDLPKREELETTSRRFAVKYLLGVMNSGSARDFLRANRRSNIHLYPDDWKKLPIPDVSEAQQQPIVALVEQILTLKRANPAADINALETQLDAAVATLYGQTPEEIAVVEGTDT